MALADFVLDVLRAQKVALAQQTDEYGRRGGLSLTERLRERHLSRRLTDARLTVRC